MNGGQTRYRCGLMRRLFFQHQTEAQTHYTFGRRETTESANMGSTWMLYVELVEARAARSLTLSGIDWDGITFDLFRRPTSTKWINQRWWRCRVSHTYQSFPCALANWHTSFSMGGEIDRLRLDQALVTAQTVLVGLKPRRSIEDHGHCVVL